MSAPVSETPGVKVCVYTARREGSLINGDHAVNIVDLQMCESCGQGHGVSMVGPRWEVDNEDSLKLWAISTCWMGAQSA